MNLVNKLLYNNQNQFLTEKANSTTNNKVGNNVININILLKHLKQDNQIINLNRDQDRNIMELTFFNLLEDEENLTMFIQWIMQKENKRKNTNIEYLEEADEHEN